MEAEIVTVDLVDEALDDAAWIFDTYHEDGDDKRPTRSNEIRARLRRIAYRHRAFAHYWKNAHGS